MSASASTASMLEIVGPVLEDMGASPLRNALMGSFATETRALVAVEDCFTRLTSKAHDQETLKYFFQNWSQTNNSASSVAGLACRVTLAARNYADDATRLSYYRVADGLQRITDEDFGACGEIPHAELYYRMATALCGDDSWLARRYRNQSSRQFRDWMLRQRLRAPIIEGLLYTLIHELYTHGEVELIHPAFHNWLPTHLGIQPRDAGKILAWITVHIGGTEKNHFRHATSTVTTYCDASGEQIDVAAAAELFSTYLRYKAAVMEELTPALH